MAGGIAIRILGGRSVIWFAGEVLPRQLPEQTKQANAADVAVATQMAACNMSVTCRIR